MGKKVKTVTNNKKKWEKVILMICPFARPNVGGVEAHLDKLISYLNKRNIFVYLITYQPLITKVRGKTIENGKNYIIYRINWFGRGWFDKIENFFPLVFFYLVPGILIRSILFYLKNHKKINVIHAHGLASAFTVKILNMIHKKRIIISTHAIYNLRKRKLLSILFKWILSSFNTILAVGVKSKKELIEIGINKSKVKVHPNWIDTNIFKSYDKKESRQILNLPEDNFIVLYIGRLIKKKGVINLIKIAEKLREDILFVIIGNTGLELDKIKEASERIKNFKHIDNLKNQDKDLELIVRYYNSADIYILPSIYEEGFASVILEGISCGTPIVATNMGCVSDIIDYSVGKLINPTVPNIIKNIEYYYENKGELLTVSKNCRPYALKNFSEKNAEVILNSYYG